MKKYLPFISVCLLLFAFALMFEQTATAQAPMKFRTFRASDYRSQSTPKSRSGYILRGRLPNAGNVRDTVFLNRGFSWEAPEDGGFLRVGHRHTDSSRWYGWFFYFRWHYSAPEVRYYIFSPSALAKSPDYLKVRGEVRTTTYFGNAGNALTQNLTAMKTNIAASDLGITPTGFGDLVFNQANGPETIFNGKTIREIVMLGDSAVTLGKLQKTKYPSSLLSLVNTVMARINTEFYSSVVETIKTKPLMIQGAKLLSAVPYLYYDPTRLMPWNRNRTQVRISNPNSYIPAMPESYSLEQNYPNPFNPSTVLSYPLSVTSTVTLTVYDAVGRVVARLVNDVQDAGVQTSEWNAEGLASGVYFYKLEATSLTQPDESFVQMKKMLLLR
ncbi:MAG: T9SS type A sorting domain-containing protein [Ignavibacteriae bacterium]|nr:T9SS type A sorting domain-containing protein [Ignavibacteriota bacterium]